METSDGSERKTEDVGRGTLAHHTFWSPLVDLFDSDLWCADDQ